MMHFNTWVRSLPIRVISGGVLTLLGSALSDLDAMVWIVIGKLLWFTGTGFALCSAMAHLRRQGRLSPTLRTFILGLLVFAAGFVMVSLWDAWQVDLARLARSS